MWRARARFAPSAGYCLSWNVTSPEYDAYQYLYKTKGWKVRRLWQLHREPYCRMCLRKQRFTPANTVDHIIAHKGNRRLFWDRNNLQSLCDVHHGDKIREEAGGPVRVVIGDDGWPEGTDDRYVCDGMK